MLECIYCGTENQDKNNFCRNCRSQIRCLECKETLESNVDMCLSCGIDLPSPKTDRQQNNTYELDEENNEKTGRSKRRIRISFSNSALQSVAPAFSGLLGGMASQGRPSHNNPRRVFQTAPPTTKVLEAHSYIESVSSEVNEGQKQPILGINSPSLLCFELDDDNKLFTTIDDFKGKRQSEQQRRFIFFYILDHQVAFQEMPSDETIIQAAEKSGFYDKNNFKTYIKQVKNDYFVEAGSLLKPKDKAHSFLDSVDKELQDPLVVGASMTPSKKPPARKRAGGAAFGEAEKQKVRELLDKYPVISQLNSREFSHNDLSAIALYLLRTFEGMPDVNIRVLYGLLSATRGYSSEFKRYSEALKRSKANHIHQKSDGTVSLLPEGEQFVQKILREKDIQI
ncbi:hypothetical protein Dcar01_01898 [Deinococcus carri]|uniref:ZZ-type domain-containing protein n=1 Tax=Deinococcus carri TaxID=1211323 RepID=A0ABP9WAG6_9DEIO